MSDPGQIILRANPKRDINFENTARVYVLLENAGFRVCVCPTERGEELPLRIKTAPLEEAARSARLVVCFGGDGTILRTARAVMDAMAQKASPSGSKAIRGSSKRRQTSRSSKAAMAARPSTAAVSSP